MTTGGFLIGSGVDAVSGRAPAHGKVRLWWVAAGKRWKEGLVSLCSLTGRSHRLLLAVLIGLWWLDNPASIMCAVIEEPSSAINHQHWNAARRSAVLMTRQISIWWDFATKAGPRIDILPDLGSAHLRSEPAGEGETRLSLSRRRRLFSQVASDQLNYNFKR